jgi:tetratricopeptide (TPR) repeat protein
MSLTRKEVQDRIEKSEKYKEEGRSSKKAIKLLEDTLSELEPSTEEYYEIVLELADVYRDNKSYTTAQDLLIEGIAKAKKYDEDLYLAQMYCSLSFIKLQKQEFNQARKYAKRALSITKNMKGFKVEKVKSNIYAILGNIYFTTKDYQDSLENYKKALKLAEKIGYERRIMTVKNDMANVYIETGEVDKARDLLLSLKKKAQKENEFAMPQILLRLARVEFIENNLEKAKEYIEESINLSKQKGWKRDIAEGREALARIYKEQNKELQKNIQLSKARKNYKDIGLDKKADKVKEMK